jgi:hypothetical protein
MANTKLSFGAAVALLLVATVSACSSEGTGEPDSEATVSQQLGTVEAGDAARSLGVAVWRTDAASAAIRGLDASGSVIAELTIDGQAGVIRTTIPDAGMLSIKNSAESTLSQEAAAYVDAAKADLDASIDATDSIPAGGNDEVDKVQYTYACYQLYSDCSITCLYGLTHGWWNACSCDQPAVECPTNPWRMALHYN